MTVQVSYVTFICGVAISVITGIVIRRMVGHSRLIGAGLGIVRGAGSGGIGSGSQS